jgi:hypothetical protein
MATTDYIQKNDIINFEDIVNAFDEKVYKAGGTMTGTCCFFNLYLFFDKE